LEWFLLLFDYLYLILLLRESYAGKHKLKEEEGLEGGPTMFNLDLISLLI
jgi:hypothetical protein